MKTKTKILHTIKNLKFFSGNLLLDKDKVDGIKENNVNLQKRFLRELEIVNKYLAVHCYNFLNPNTLVLPQEFRFLLTKATTPYVEVKSINKKFPKMSDEEFDMYLEIYKELQDEGK
jgi:hypothetical protein